MKHSIVALALAGILAGCGQPADTQSQNQQAAAEQPVTQAEQSETQRLNAWFEEKYQQQLQQSPMQMTFVVKTAMAKLTT